MEDNEILTGNRLIAEFMGCSEKQIYICGIPTNKYYFPNASDIHDYITDFENETPYHTSFDWLMPVVEKMEGKDIIFEISRNYCQISKITEYGTEVLYAKSAPSKLQAVYAAVIQFITYHNNLKALNTIEDEK